MKRRRKYELCYCYPSSLAAEWCGLPDGGFYLISPENVIIKAFATIEEARAYLQENKIKTAIWSIEKSIPIEGD